MVFFKLWGYMLGFIGVLGIADGMNYGQIDAVTLFSSSVTFINAYIILYLVNKKLC